MREMREMRSGCVNVSSINKKNKSVSTNDNSHEHEDAVINSNNGKIPSTKNKKKNKKQPKQ